MPLARELTQEGIGVSLTGLGDVAVRRVALNHVQGRPVVYIAPVARSGMGLMPSWVNSRASGTNLARSWPT